MRRHRVGMVKAMFWCCVLGSLSVGRLSAQASSGVGAVSLKVAQAEDVALRNNPRISIARLLALAQGQVTREVRHDCLRLQVA
ncbi:MAG: outer rane efflux protein [Edaphobacter sp.]|nr:outer rane efflux protein [Edaphobacter sp.]